MIEVWSKTCEVILEGDDQDGHCAHRSFRRHEALQLVKPIHDHAKLMGAFRPLGLTRLQSKGLWRAGSHVRVRPSYRLAPIGCWKAPQRFRNTSINRSRCLSDGYSSAFAVAPIRSFNLSSSRSPFVSVSL